MATFPQPYPALGELRVGDAMHAGLISCPPEATLRTVARMMATYRVHAILVHANGRPVDGRGWGVVCDADVLRAAETSDLGKRTARSAATRSPLTVAPTDSVAQVARLMLEHRVSHVVVVDSQPPRPVGVLSTLDIARALAGFPERHPIRT